MRKLIPCFLKKMKTLFFLLLVIIAQAESWKTWMPPKNKCRFDYAHYEHGATLDCCKSCFSLQCDDGKWIPAQESQTSCSCERCYAHNDPHFKTFDGTYYDHHGTCRYALAQYGYDQEPPYGIFADFKTCGSASCINRVWFKSGTTEIKINHDDANNVFELAGPAIPLSTSHAVDTGNSVLAWKHGDCVRVVGPELSMEVCWHSVYVLTSPCGYKKLAGLCGYFDFDATNDLTSRGPPSQIMPMANVLDFAISWKTNFQEDFHCSAYKDEVENCDLDIARQICETIGGDGPCDNVIVQAKIEDCIKDVCLGDHNTDWRGVAVNLLQKEQGFARPN